MTHVLPELSFSPDALAPFLSAETMGYHHGRHHRGYVSKLNELVEGSELADLSLTDLVKRTSGPTFENAGQHYNHSFYWRCLSPDPIDAPEGFLKRAIERDFGSRDALRETLVEKAKGLFGSGWCWLARDDDGRLSVHALKDAGNPLREGLTPVLTCDVWEHAYYIDHRNDRGAYVDGFWKAIDWDFARRAYEQPERIEPLILPVG